MLNPFFRDKKAFIAYISIWIIISFVHFLVLYSLLNNNFEYSLLDSIIFNLLYLGIGLSLWYPAKFISLENYNIIKIIFNHFAAAAITSIIWVYTGYTILTKTLLLSGEYGPILKSTLFGRFIVGIVYYAIIVSIDYIIIYYNNFQQKLIKEAELKSLVKEAELKNLKYQINPHFIFNSLNSISSLTLSDPKRAQEMTINLSRFLRATLAENDKQKIKLSEEIKNIRTYLEIEKVRFEDKFEFIEEIEPDCLKIEIPSMLLQPLFENAIKHGVYESVVKVLIIMRCSFENSYLKIEVINNFDPEAVSAKGEGIGLSNISKRLSLIFNQNNLLEIEKKENKYGVTILVPIRAAENG